MKKHVDSEDKKLFCWGTQNGSGNNFDLRGKYYTFINDKGGRRNDGSGTKKLPSPKRRVRLDGVIYLYDKLRLKEYKYYINDKHVGKKF